MSDLLSEDELRSPDSNSKKINTSLSNVNVPVLRTKRSQPFDKLNSPLLKKEPVLREDDKENEDLKPKRKQKDLKKSEFSEDSINLEEVNNRIAEQWKVKL